MSRKRYSYSEDTEIKALELFDSGYRIKDICQYLNLTKSTGRLLIIRNGRKPVPRYEQSREVKFNPFGGKDEVSRYWLGFFIADGYIQSDRRNTVYLSSSDTDHIEKFVQYIGKSSYHTKDNGCHTAHFANRETRDFLVSLGVTSDKSHGIDFKGDLDWHLIRGYFDGDGSVSGGIPKITGCCNSFLRMIENYLQRYGIDCAVHTKDRRKPHQKDLRLRSDGRFLFYHYLYKNATIFLERKRNDYRSVLKKFRAKNTGLIAGTLPDEELKGISSQA